MDLRWTTGYDDNLEHQSEIEGGGFGEVHKIISFEECRSFYQMLYVQNK